MTENYIPAPPSHEQFVEAALHILLLNLAWIMTHICILLILIVFTTEPTIKLVSSLALLVTSLIIGYNIWLAHKDWLVVFARMARIK